MLIFRARMIKVGLLPKLVLLMKKCSEDPVQHPRSANLQNSVVCVLYHLSIEDKVKSMFAYTDCIPLVMKMVLETVEDQVHRWSICVLFYFCGLMDHMDVLHLKLRRE